MKVKPIEKKKKKKRFSLEGSASAREGEREKIQAFSKIYVKCTNQRELAFVLLLDLYNV